MTQNSQLDVSIKITVYPSIPAPPYNSNRLFVFYDFVILLFTSFKCCSKDVAWYKNRMNLFTYVNASINRWVHKIFHALNFFDRIILKSFQLKKKYLFFYLNNQVELNFTLSMFCFPYTNQYIKFFFIKRKKLKTYVWVINGIRNSFRRKFSSLSKSN